MSFFIELFFDNVGLFLPPPFPNHATRCAYSVPGVLQTLGKDRWNELKHVHASLSSNTSIHVRRSLAFSLHHIATIVGPDVAEQDLCQIFDQFIKDEEMVRVGAITHLASFLKQLHLPARESYLPVMAEVIETADESNWRVRESIASQLPAFSSMFTPPATFSVVVSVLFRLLHDEISIVRRKACSCCGLLINRLAEEQDVDWSEQLCTRLMSLSTQNTYQRRLTFVHVCESLIHQVSDWSCGVHWVVVLVCWLCWSAGYAGLLVCWYGASWRGQQCVY